MCASEAGLTRQGDDGLEVYCEAHMPRHDFADFDLCNPELVEGKLRARHEQLMEVGWRLVGCRVCARIVRGALTHK